MLADKHLPDNRPRAEFGPKADNPHWMSAIIGEPDSIFLPPIWPPGRQISASLQIVVSVSRTAFGCIRCHSYYASTNLFNEPAFTMAGDGTTSVFMSFGESVSSELPW